jgi:hypothetical protein
VLAKLARRLFIARAMPELQMPLPRLAPERQPTA